jgi:hypothetical protein
MNTRSKQFALAMAIAAATITGLKAGSTSQNEEVTPASNGPANVSLTVEGGTSSGSYAAGTVVIVTANAPSAGAQFTGWTGDMVILTNPFSPTTTALVPQTAVTIRATFKEPAPNFAPTPKGNWEG